MRHPYRRLRGLPLLTTLVLALVLAAPAAAAPVQTGTLSAASPSFEWSGGPLSGGNLNNEPCGTTHQCEDILLHTGNAGNLKITWQASSPAGQGWLSFTLYKSDADGNVEGEPVADTGAFDNEGALVAIVEAGHYVVRVGALLSAAATYDAQATLAAGADDDGGEKGDPPPDASAHDWYTEAGAEWRQAYIEVPDGTRLHADILRPAGMPADQEDAGDPLDRPVLQPHGPDRRRRARPSRPPTIRSRRPAPRIASPTSSWAPT